MLCDPSTHGCLRSSWLCSNAEESAASVVDKNLIAVERLHPVDLSRLADPVDNWLTTVQRLREHRRTTLVPGLAFSQPKNERDMIRMPLESLPDLRRLLKED